MDQVIICEQCGSPDVREVERPPTTLGMGPTSWRCIDCGHEQSNADAPRYFTASGKPVLLTTGEVDR